LTKFEVHALICACSYVLSHFILTEVTCTQYMWMHEHKVWSCSQALMCACMCVCICVCVCVCGGGEGGWHTVCTSTNISCVVRNWWYWWYSRQCDYN